MTQFEFIFALYALLLGLSLIELLSGLGRALELKFASEADKRTFAIGWLTPALAVFVMLDLLSFWIFAWRVRELLEVTPLGLMVVMAFASAYFLAARLVFPGDPARFSDLDNHYFRVRRVIMAILIGLVAVQWIYLLTIPEIRSGLLNLWSIALTFVLVALMAGTMVTSKPRLSLTLLVLLILRYVVIYAI